MNRRGFLGMIGAIATMAAVDPERLLWVPGKKHISIPKPQLIRLGDLTVHPVVFTMVYHLNAKGDVFAVSEQFDNGEIVLNPSHPWIGHPPPLVFLPPLRRSVRLPSAH